MNKELEKAIDEFYEAFGKAHDLRGIVMDMLEDLGLDSCEYDGFQDEDAWVYGINISLIEDLLRGDISQ